MDLKEKRSVISRELKALEPGSLYITISVPRSSSYQHHSSNSTVSYPTCLSEHLDLASYEVSCAKGIDREEFDWGVYFHREYGNGTWYGLRRVSSTIGRDGTLGSSVSNMVAAGMGDGASVACSLPFYTLSRQEMRLSPRLQTRVAALIRVLRVPDSFADGLTPYLDWLAVQTAPSATRSFIWATSMYLRTRHHVSAYLNGTVGDVAATGFTTTGFLQEALHLAYKEVWYGLGGQLPRPMIASAFGVEIVLEEANANMQHRNADHNADQDADDKSTQYLYGGGCFRSHIDRLIGLSNQSLISPRCPSPRFLEQGVGGAGEAGVCFFKSFRMDYSCSPAAPCKVNGMLYYSVTRYSVERQITKDRR